jgi:DNA (cytosine-5)-methyltransferase 1
VMHGFPATYLFPDTSLSNAYRHIGDAVPPLVSYQLAHLAKWILTNEQPGMQELVLPYTSLNSGDLIREAA